MVKLCLANKCDETLELLFECASTLAQLSLLIFDLDRSTNNDETFIGQYYATKF